MGKQKEKKWQAEFLRWLYVKEEADFKAGKTTNPVIPPPPPPK